MKMDPFPATPSNTHQISAIFELIPKYINTIKILSSCSYQSQSLLDSNHQTEIHPQSYLDSMDRGKNQLRERLLAKFLKNPEYLSSTRVMQGLFREEGQCLQEIFQARYDPLFLQNITSKTVFFQTMDNLAIMVACNLGLKNANKTLKNLIFSNDTFLFNFLALLFTDKEKQIVFDRLNSKFNSRAEEQRQFECEENEASNEKEEGLHTLFYILKNLLRIRSEENLQEQHEELDQSF